MFYFAAWLQKYIQLLTGVLFSSEGTLVLARAVRSTRVKASAAAFSIYKIGLCEAIDVG